MASFVLSFLPLDVLDEIWDLIESVSEGFLTYSYIRLTMLSKKSLSMFNRSSRYLEVEMKASITPDYLRNIEIRIKIKIKKHEDTQE